MAAPHNPVGSKSEKIWRDAVMRAVKRRNSKEEPQALEKLADELVATALAGDVTALKEIGDRLDGKPTQQLQHSGDAQSPLVVNVVKFADDNAAGK